MARSRWSLQTAKSDKLLAITIVSGLPRSGTSMMMQALRAGGMPVLSDQARVADDDNPRGYFELELAKTIEHDTSWLPQAQGKAVKVISALLRHLPRGYEYKIIFMQREMREILASQQAMLRRRGAPASANDASLARRFRDHLTAVASWLAQQSNMRAVYVDYREVLSDPVRHLARVRDFLGAEMNLDAMVAVVDETLHRQRSGD